MKRQVLHGELLKLESATLPSSADMSNSRINDALYTRNETAFGLRDATGPRKSPMWSSYASAPPEMHFMPEP